MIEKEEKHSMLKDILKGSAIFLTLIAVFLTIAVAWLLNILIISMPLLLATAALKYLFSF